MLRLAVSLSVSSPSLILHSPSFIWLLFVGSVGDLHFTHRPDFMEVRGGDGDVYMWGFEYE